MNCLVIRFSSLGDIVLTTPVVAALSAAFPEVRIHYAVMDRFSTVVEHFPHQVVIHPFTGHDRDDLLAFAEGIAAESFDLIFDLHANWRSHMLINHLDAGEVHAYPKDFWRRWRMVYLKHGFHKTRPVIERYLSTLDAAQVPMATDIPQLRSDPAKKKAAAGELFQLGWPVGRPTVGIGWGAHWPTKQAPAYFWEDMFERLSMHQNPVYILFAEEADEDEIHEFMVRNEKYDLIPFCGKNLELVFGALAWCKAFVTSDSGLMHAAAALGVPTWGLFGPTHPALGFAPRGADSRAVHSGIFCSPCSRHGKAACYRRRRYCFERIDAGAIAAEIAERLQAEAEK